MKSCYKLLVGEAHSQRPWAKIWKMQVPPKVKVFCWQMACSFLPTRDALNMKQVPCFLMCHMCDNVVESAYHLFVVCHYVNQVWNNLLGGLPGMSHPHGVLADWLFDCMEMLSDEVLCKLIMISYGLWSSRKSENGRGSRLIWML